VKKLTAAQWHTRFQQQAAWTLPLRKHLFERCGADSARRILEVGCGTGAVLNNFFGQKTLTLGVDLAFDFLLNARSHSSNSIYLQADGYHLPFAPVSFDISFCHYFLLWISNPVQVIRAMAAVTHSSGWIMALAEPDYGGRIDYPIELAELGRLQGDALREQGADPYAGRKLSAWFHEAGLIDIQTGLVGGEWNSAPSESAWESEWATLNADLADRVNPARLGDLRRLDASAWQHGQRVLFVPTFFALGKVP